MTRRRGAPRRRVAFRSRSRFLPVPRVSILRGDGSTPSAIPCLERSWRDTAHERAGIGHGRGGVHRLPHRGGLSPGRVGGRRARRSLSRPRAQRSGRRAVRPRRHPLARGAEAAGDGRVRRRSTITPPRSTSGSRSTSRPSTRASTSSGLVNLLEGAGEGGVKRVIFASSGGVVYGDPDVIPTPETAPKLPVCPYGVSKLVGRVLPPGARRPPRIRGRGDAVRERVRPSAGSQVRGRRRLDLRVPPARQAKLTVFGDGKQTRDYVFVKDVARANVLASTVSCPSTASSTRRRSTSPRRVRPACSSSPTPSGG